MSSSILSLVAVNLPFANAALAVEKLHVDWDEFPTETIKSPLRPHLTTVDAVWSNAFVKDKPWMHDSWQRDHDGPAFDAGAIDHAADQDSVQATIHSYLHAPAPDTSLFGFAMRDIWKTFCAHVQNKIIDLKNSPDDTSQRNRLHFLLSCTFNALQSIQEDSPTCVQQRRGQFFFLIKDVMQVPDGRDLLDYFFEHDNFKEWIMSIGSKRLFDTVFAPNEDGEWTETDPAYQLFTNDNVHYLLSKAPAESDFLAPNILGFNLRCKSITWPVEVFLRWGSTGV